MVICQVSLLPAEVKVALDASLAQLGINVQEMGKQLQWSVESAITQMRGNLAVILAILITIVTRPSPHLKL
jgi:hypothetical protein